MQPYIPQQSYHYTRIQNLHKSVKFRQSSDQDIFHNDKSKYIEALKQSKHKVKLRFLGR